MYPLRPQFLISFGSMTCRAVWVVFRDCMFSLFDDWFPNLQVSAMYAIEGCSNAELQWLRRCLPIFRQPEFELRNKNGLVKVFFQFDRGQQTSQLHCTLYIVFRSKSSYNCLNRISENRLATLLLRTYTRAAHQSTADIKTLQFRYVVSRTWQLMDK